MKKNNTIIISGLQGSGKSSIAEELRKQLESKGYIIQVNKFAKILYELEELIWKHLNNLDIKAPKRPDKRLIQLLDINWGRKIDKDIWIKVIQHQMKKFEAKLSTNSNSVFIIDDCRFDNEFHSFPEAYNIRLICDEDIRKKRTNEWKGDVPIEDFFDPKLPIRYALYYTISSFLDFFYHLATRNRSKQYRPVTEYLRSKIQVQHVSETELQEISDQGLFDIYINTEITTVKSATKTILKELERKIYEKK